MGRNLRRPIPSHQIRMYTSGKCGPEVWVVLLCKTVGHQVPVKLSILPVLLHPPWLKTKEMEPELVRSSSLSSVHLGPSMDIQNPISELVNKRE